MAHPWFKKFLSILLLLGFGFGLTGLVVELGVRLWFPVSDFFWDTHPVLGVKLMGGKRGRFVRPGLFDVQVDTNSHGFRDRERNYAKLPALKRIAALGDSYVEALQVPIENTLTANLEQKMRAKGLAAEALNLGVSGYGTGREYLMLREYGVKYNPDLVLMFFVGNDLLNNNGRLEGLPYVPYPLLRPDGNLSRDGAGEPRFTQIHDSSSPFSLVTAFLGQYSNAYRFFRTMFERSPTIHSLLFRFGITSTPPASGRPRRDNLGLFEIYRVAENDSLSESWRLTEALLLEVKRLSDKHRARFAVVLVPAPWEVYPEDWEQMLRRMPPGIAGELDLNKPSRRMVNFLDSRGIAYVDLLPAFRAKAATSPRLFFRGDNHWTAEGHALAADQLVEPVAKLLATP